MNFKSAIDRLKESRAVKPEPTLGIAALLREHGRDRFVILEWRDPGEPAKLRVVSTGEIIIRNLTVRITHEIAKMTNGKPPKSEEIELV